MSWEHATVAKQNKRARPSARAASKSRREPAKKASRAPAERPAATKRPPAGLRGAKQRGANGSVFADLKPNAANFAPLTPISFLPRTAAIHPDRLAVVHGTRQFTYSQLQERVRRLASALARR